MRKNLQIAACLLAALSWACSQEPEVEIDSNSGLVEMYLDASVVSSKVELGDNMLSPLWQEGDELAVYDGLALRKFRLVSGAGTQSAVFSGQAYSGASSLTAVYPYSAAKVSAGKVTYTIPADQTVSAPGADPAALVMQAKAAVGATLKFSNCTSLLRFSVPEGVTKVTFILDDYHAALSLPGIAGTYALAIEPGLYSTVTALIRTSDSSFIMESGNMLIIDASTSISMGALSLQKSVITISTPAEMTSFLGSASASDKSEVYIINDIDMTGTQWTPAAGFGGVLNGLDYTVTVTGATGPLFESNDGTINSLVIDGSITSSGLECAALVHTNNGTVVNVTNKASLKIEKSAGLTLPIVMGGIAAYNYGSIFSSSNQGEVKFSSSSSITGLALGGIAGYSEGPLSLCTNSAPVSVSFKYGSGMCALGKIESSAANLGGIVGAAWEGFSLKKCYNSGKITYINDAIENCSSKYQRIQIGGVAGSPYGSITDCGNTGDMYITAVTSDRSAFSALNYILDVGGISGGSFHETGDYQALNDHTDIVGCTNDGDIVVDFDATASNSPIGGIVGWPSGEKLSTSCRVSGCTNTGDLTMSGKGKVRLGGVMGGTGSLDNCTNSGKVYVKSADANSTAGGICAFHSQDHALYKCVNTGNVVSDVALFGLGGLIGCHGGVNLTSSLSCKVLCDVISAASDRGSVGMVLGTYNKETTKAVVLGSTEEPIEVKGHVQAGGVSTELNEKNFENYLSGTTYVSSTHLIYAYCTTPAPDEYAEGTVKYDDGQPASGISVSDGFSVVTTGADGKFRLNVSQDCWYIYVSIPSDAVIGKNSNGCPDFYLPYKGTDYKYDFTLKRQAVENEFMLFALADPQAHNSNRGTGKTDTDRFNLEAVPAINNVISQQTLPCYGVTLGDIVYSEGSRNSNGGMTTMRTHCAKINMPVFQTMGNHDYTYFYSSKPLTVDSKGRSLYLRAQRQFEEVFGPINFSFNRGDVHVVCMRNIIYNSTTDASDYILGYTDEQWEWLKEDLANVPKTKSVILCGHIPLVNRTGADYKHVNDIMTLLKTYKSPRIFSGHTHYKRYYTSKGIPEHIHAAVCGQWWWSNVEGDGVPNGYTVYHVKGTSFADEFFIGINNNMNTRDYQIRAYRGNTTNGGSYARFKWPHEATRLMINVFNGDSRWTVRVYEDGVLGGIANLMTYKRQTYSSVTNTTYVVDADSSNDWWAIGYHIGVRGRGRTSESYYTSMYHMYTYTVKNPDAALKIEATDGYGNKYTCTEIFDSDSYYPAYMKFGNVN